MEEPERPDNPSSRPLDLISASTLVSASMIGAGIFVTSGFTLGDLESRELVLLAWAVAGLIAICGAVCYAALASKFTESGGEYLFLSRALHPIAGMMAGWVSLLAGFTGAIAFAAGAFGEYLLPLLPTSIQDSDYSPNIVATLIVIAAALLHSIGVKPGARVQDVVVGLKFLLIAAFIVFSFRALGVTDDASSGTTGSSETPWIGLRFATALMWISLSYSGFNAAVYVAGEVKAPERNVPRAIVLGTIVVTIAYLLLNTIFLYSTPASEIKFQEQVATIAAQSIGGQSFAWFVRIVILICLFTSVSALVMTGPRVYSKMADDGFLPSLLRFQNRPPTVSIWLQAGLACVVIWISRLQDLLDYLGFTLSVSAALTASLLLVMKDRPKQIPLYPLPPIVFVGATLLTASLAAYRNPTQAIVGVATIACGAAIYPFYRRKQV